ncbi:VOC family protein [Antrihabitans cavernicola]|uniref:Glyoxalase n=1 Tax=Antrihabitans cavernicola TaxID=2495913 RepID=A0A5A7SFH0_9NOCA|nr:VOC family protein [Spelaeibacter cavernicola]KAA0024878.1 glyoxalase [Spelaeibacter cavernicola]
MATKIFVNYPISDLERSKAFYTALGATIDPRFTDDNGACLVWGEDIITMILKREFFASFTDKQVADPATTAQMQLAFSRDSREEVDAVVEAGLAAGGTEPKPAQDYGFMYSRDMEDPDGNIVAFIFMEPAAVEQGPEAYMAAQAQA